jgi:anti-sigma-K factor RskA
VNIQEYILSGAVESYVLGLANEEERAQFESLYAAHPELRAAREAFELSLEKLAFDEAVQPPAKLKSRIFSEIDVESDRKPTGRFKIKPLTPVRSIWPRYVAAASLILLVASTALNFYFFGRYKAYIAKYDALVASQTQMVANNQQLQVKMQDYKSVLELIKDPGMAVVKMTPTEKSPAPTSATTVYWDTRSKDVYLLVNSLPQPIAGKQYQLWALVDGKPVDAGVFDIKAGIPFVKMKNTQQAQAFAITLENAGGSPTPTMDALYVLGKVTS